MKEQRRQLTFNFLDSDSGGVVLGDELRIQENSLENSGGSSFAKWCLNTELGGSIEEQEARNRDF